MALHSSQRIPRSVVRTAPLALAALAALALLATAPLTEEDVVRMHVAGKSVDEILRVIAEREVDFDLSPEMVRELRVAGLPSRILRAMEARQAETRPREPASPPRDPDRTPGARLTIRFVAHKPGKELEVIYPSRLMDERLAGAHKLGFDRSGWEVDEIAVFLGCGTSDHVPDGWRAKSPVGRDFVAAPRHRLLAFHAGAEPATKRRTTARLRARLGGGTPGAVPREFLRLALPAELTADVEPEIAHDLVLGLAVRVAGVYRVLALAERPTVVVPPEGLQIEAALWSMPRAGALEPGVRFSDH